MPATMIASLAKDSGKTEKEVEVLWDKAKELAKEQDHEEDYPYIVGILKKMLSINEAIKNWDFPSFGEYNKALNEAEDYFKELGKNYIFIAKIHKSKGLISLTFKDETGSKNAYEEISTDIKEPYKVSIKDNIVTVVKEG